MHRVAAKPAEHPDTPRGTRAAKRTRAGSAGTRSRTGSAARRSPGAPVSPEVMEELDGMAATARVDTLVRWAQWELISVPRERLRWMKTLLLG